MMNKKGQTLVIFVLILPVIILAIYTLINKGNMYYQKRILDNTIKSALNYGLDNIEDEQIESKIKNYIEKNIESENQIKINDKIITITSTIKIDKLSQKIGFENITVTYTGYKENNKNILIKE